jgi:predicted protein tyrosine phosphatase/isopentenyldiphosphate isomerase
LKSCRTKILFVCSRNRRRSLTAETIFKDVSTWEVRSAGTEQSARIKVTAGHVGWADLIVLMEKRHKERLQQMFPQALTEKQCLCLFIPDDYEFMDPELISVLQRKLRPYISQPAPLPFMSEEIFDVVNERDEVIDRQPRSEVHRRGLLHRAVHILVFNSRGQVFLQKRSITKDKSPGLWDSSASGHVDSGEPYDATAVRELREEIGLSIGEPPKRLFKIEVCPETDQEFVWVYRCEAEGPFELNADEIESGDWFAPEEITRWISERPQEFASAFVYLWKRLLRQGGAPIAR